MPLSSLNNERIVRNTMFLYFRMLLVMAVSLYTSRIVLKALGIVDYGLYNVVSSVIIVFSYVNNSMATATSRFLTFELGKHDLGKMRLVFANSFSIHTWLALIVFLLGEFVGIYMINNILNIPTDRLIACHAIYQFVIISAVFTITQVPFNSLIVSYERMNIYAYVGIFDALSKCLIAYLLLVLPWDKLIVYSVLQLVGVLVIYLFYWRYCKLKFPQIFCITTHVDKKIIKEMFGFTTWSLLGSSANMFRNTGVNILINIFFGSVVNAANGIAYQVNAAVANFTNSFTMAMNPQIIKTYATGDYERNKTLILRGAKFSFFLLLILCYPIIFEVDFLLSLWLSEYPPYTTILTKLVLILSLVEIFNQSVGCAIQATGRIKQYQLTISGMILLVFPISYEVFYMGYPPYAALGVSILISILALIARLYFIKILLNISPLEYLKSVIIRCFFVAVLSFIIPYFIHCTMDVGFTRLGLVVLAEVLSSSFIIYFLGMNQTERNFINRAVLTLICKIK